MGQNMNKTIELKVKNHKDISVLEVRFKNELVRVLVHLTKKRTIRSVLVLREKVS